jgi:deoxyribonuclease (pyrimidine dimer)
MTRINVVHPRELHRLHLVAEYRELPRVFNLAANCAANLIGGYRLLPEKYALGKGHVLFFYNKLTYLDLRHQALVKEMTARGIAARFPDAASRWRDNSDLQRLGWWNDYHPTQEAICLNRERLEARRPACAS